MPKKNQLSAKTITAKKRCFVFVILFTTMMAVIQGISLPSISKAEPLEYVPFTTLGAKAYFSWIDGRMGFEQQVFGQGTLNDFKTDLGLPIENRTYQINLSVRPLEHHLLWAFGRIPEHYSGERILSRELRTRNIIYPAGSLVNSEMWTGMYSFGYDLDLLIGPRWYGGFNGELRYVHLKLRLRNSTSGLEDTMSLDELTPCLGAHVRTVFPRFLNAFIPGVTIGGFTRMSYSIFPNYFNYVDILAGGAFTLNSPWTLLDLKVAYEHESFFHNQENFSGRSLELKRDGISVSLDLAF